ncbi:alpha/beta fold hydrolase [Streptomyces sp. NPDC048258]|uniref:alpha/beta fold hydrolase n=1 Tax=Streptomyces sp. NPDC048258 TaxID=3365527 RepID=UPI00371C9E67
MHVKGIESWDLAYDGRQALHRTEDGSELYYELRGTEGPVVTLVSTIYVVSTAWRNFTGNLVGDHRLLSYDLRNQGASEGHPAEFAQHTEDLKSLLDDLGIERTYLVGTSISTLICRDFANAYPERVAGLVLVGPPFSPRGSSRRRRIAKSWLAALDAGGPRALFDLIYPLVFGDKAIAEGGSGAYLALRERFLAINSAAQLRANLREALGAGDQVERLTGIEAATLLLSGDDDFSTTESTLDATAAIMPNAAVEIIRECGHLPYFEQPEAFQDAVARFVASVEGGTFPAPWTAPATEGKDR